MSRNSEGRSNDIFELSSTEEKVLDLLLAGLSNIEIAEELKSKVRTIDFHLKSIKLKKRVQTNERLIVTELNRRFQERLVQSSLLPTGSGG